MLQQAVRMVTIIKPSGTRNYDCDLKGERYATFVSAGLSRSLTAEAE